MNIMPIRVEHDGNGDDNGADDVNDVDCLKSRCWFKSFYLNLLQDRSLITT